MSVPNKIGQNIIGKKLYFQRTMQTNKVLKCLLLTHPYGAPNLGTPLYGEKHCTQGWAYHDLDPIFARVGIAEINNRFLKCDCSKNLQHNPT